MAVKCPKCHSENPDDTMYCGKCAAPLSSAGEVEFSLTKALESPVRVLAKGSILAGKYRIVEPIGKGGMGVVYKAEDTKLKRTVAVKFLPSELTEDAEAGERFLREAQAAAALSHPHICTIHEIGEEEKQAFIVMEYIEGPSLKQKIFQGPLDQAEALAIAIQVAEGLDEAHKKGIVHRDIKPGNIMVTATGQAKVTDFGLAKVLGQSLITKEARTMGTAAYMSPEQAGGETLDQRTDIWSLGVVLFEMVAGQLPFGGENEASLLYSIVHRAPRLIRRIEPKTSPDLERVIGKALAKNPSNRYQSMGEMLEDLRAIAEGMKPPRAKAGLLRGRILGIRNPYFYAGLAVLAALIVWGVFILYPGRGDVLDSIAILPLVNDSGDPDQDYFANGLTDLLINELYKVAALNVASRQDVMRYKNSGKALKEIAGELNVKALVEASVLKSGDKIRLTARLIDPYRNNRILWAETMEREHSEILMMQSDFSQAIVSGIKVAVTPAEKTLLVVDRKVDPEAYDAFLKGLGRYGAPLQPQETLLSKFMNALDYFQKAIDIDPNLAQAQAWKAHILLQFGAEGFEDEKEVFPKARDAALKALELDDNLAEAHRSLGLIKQALDWDFPGAEHEMKKALDLKPGDGMTQVLYPRILACVGKTDEAVAFLNRSIEQDTREHGRRRYAYWNTTSFLLMRRYKEALIEQRNVVSSESEPDWGDIMTLATAYALNGMHSEALEQINKIKDLPGPREDQYFRLHHAWILGICGQREEALIKLEELRALLSRRNIDPAYYTACVYAGLGDNDKAFEYLGRAYENHSSMMVWLLADYWLNKLHADPRFEVLRKRMGL